MSNGECVMMCLPKIYCEELIANLLNPKFKIHNSTLLFMHSSLHITH